MPVRSVASEAPQSSRAGRMFLIASLATLAALGAAVVAYGLTRPAPQKAATLRPAAVAPAHDERVVDFINNVALSHVAPPRAYEEPAAPAERSAAAATPATAKPRPVVKSAAKPVEVAVLPPARPAAALPAQVEGVAPAPERTRLKVEAIGLDVPLPSLPSVADMGKLVPSPKQIGQKAVDLADKAASWLPFR